jgi:pimeloyl-ACP methyl ester carboxylesterase
MEALGLGWPPPPFARLGWFTAGFSNPEMTKARGMAFLFRGQGMVFSRGFGRLCGRLRAKGIWAEDFRCIGDHWAARRVRSVRPFNLPVVLIGHSRGGRRAIVVAQRLERLGASVELLLCLDTAFPALVPANVRRALHLRIAGRRIYPAAPLRAVDDSNTQIDNLVLGDEHAPSHERWMNHLNVTAWPPVQNWVFDRVMTTFSRF